MNEHKPTRILRLFELAIAADEHERAEILDREAVRRHHDRGPGS